MKKRVTGKEKNYKEIAKRKIHRPAQVKRLPKLFVYSRNKKGKTTFGASAGLEHTLIADPENGTDIMVSSNPHVWAIDTWEDMDDLYKFLRLGEHQFKWVVLDALHRLNNMSLNFVMKQAEEKDLDRRPGTVRRQDYGRSGELMKIMLNQFLNLPMGVVITCAERMISIEGEGEDDEGGTFFVPDLPQGVRGVANGLVDVIGRLYVVKVNVKKGGKIVRKQQRRLWIAPHERYDTGYRSDFPLPDMIRNPTVPRLVKLIREGA